MPTSLATPNVAAVLSRVQGRSVPAARVLQGPRLDAPNRRRQPLRPSPASDVLGSSLRRTVGDLVAGHRLADEQRCAVRTSVGGVLVDPASFVSDRNHDALGHSTITSAQATVSTLSTVPVSLRQQYRRPHAPVTRSVRSGPVIGSTLLGVVLLALVGVVMASTDAAAARPDSPTPATLQVVVQPGDSIWTIARRVQPEGDVRPLVQSIIESHGSAAVDAGEPLTIPLGR